MNKSKISGKIKSLALLCLYATIRFGGTSIVSSCGSENASARSINYFEKIKADLEKEKTDAIQAKDEAINDKKAVETENTKLKKEKTILSKKATALEVFDALIKSDKEIKIKLVSSNNQLQMETNLLDDSIWPDILLEINKFVYYEEEKLLTADNIFDIVYDALMRIIQEKFLILIRSINGNGLDFSGGSAYFIGGKIKNTTASILENKEIVKGIFMKYWAKK